MIIMQELLTQGDPAAILDPMAAQQIKQARAAYVAALQERRRELLDELRTVERDIAAVQAAAISFSPRARRTRNGVSVKEQIATILKGKGEPMYASDIVDVLQASGVTISEKDARATVVTAARRLVQQGRARQTGPNTFESTEGAA